MCRLYGVRAVKCYAWRARPRSQRAIDDAALIVKIERTYVRSRETYGSPRVHAALVDSGEDTGRSGCEYSRETILERLANAQPPNVRAEQFRRVDLKPEVALIIYL